MMRNTGCGFVALALLGTAANGCGGASGSASDDEQQPADDSTDDGGATDNDGAEGNGSGVQPASATPVPNYVAGTRLAPRVVTVEPGLFAPLGFDDTELGLPCGVGTAEDLVQRCLPQTNVRIYFADAACTAYRGVWETEALCGAEPPPVVASWELTEDACDGAVGLRRVGEVPASSELYEWWNGECVASPAPAEEVVVYALERVPPETFVAMDWSPAPRSSELGVVGWAGEDGSFMALSLYDPGLGSSCSRWTAEPENRCFPTHAYIAGYVDAECSAGATPLARADSCFGWPPVTLVTSTTIPDQTQCDGRRESFEFFERGEVREGVLTHTVAPGQCTQLDDNPAPLELVFAGERIDPSSFPLLETYELGGGDVRIRFDGIGGEPYVPASLPLFDARSGLRCDARLFADGAHYCLPISFSISGGAGIPTREYYAEANCTGQRLERWHQPLPCAPELEGVVLGDGRGNTCDSLPIHETRLVIGETDASEVYSYDPESGACEPFRPTDGTLVDGVPRWYLLGEPIPPEERFGKVEIGRVE